MKKISRVSTIISAIMLLTYIIVLISIWSRIPDTVPTHFNAAGVADSYGSKRNLVFEPVLAAFLLLFLSLMERIPAIWNFPVAVTEENRERLYKIAMIMMGGIKVLVTADVYDAWSDDDIDYRIDCTDGSSEIVWNKKTNKNPLVQYVYPKS